MNEINIIPSADDFEQEFRRTIRDGNKIQVIKFARLDGVVILNSIVIA